MRDVSKTVVDLYQSKLSAIRLASDAAITVLRVDQVRKLLPSKSLSTIVPRFLTAAYRYRLSWRKWQEVQSLARDRLTRISFKSCSIDYYHWLKNFFIRARLRT